MGASAIDDALVARHAAPPPVPNFRTRLTLSPASATLFAGATIRFHLRSNGSAAPDASYRLVGSGTIDRDGGYRAPERAPDIAAIVAASGAGAVSALVTVAPAPDLRTPLAIVSCYDDGTIDVRDASRLTPLGSASAGERAAGIAVDAARRTAYVASGDRLVAFDLSTARLSMSASVGGARFSEVAMLAGGYVAATDNNALAGAAGVRIFRTGRGLAPVLAASLAAGDTPEGIAATSDGRMFFVGNVNGNSLMRVLFDGRGHARSDGMAKTGNRPFGIAVDTVHGMVFVADNDTPTVSGLSSQPGVEIFSLPNMRRVARLTTGTPNALPLGVAVDARADRLFVTNEGDGTVVAYSLTTRRRIASAPAGRTPWLLAVDAARGRLYVPSALGNSIDVFDTRTLRPIASDVSTCGYPTSIAIMPKSM